MTSDDPGSRPVRPASDRGLVSETVRIILVAAFFIAVILAPVIILMALGNFD